MYRVSVHRVVGDGPATDVCDMPDLTSACKIATAIFEALKICSDKPMDMRQRVIPVGAAFEIFVAGRARRGYTRDNFIAYIRCQELPDEREEK